jgi:hypothetical protein
MKRLPPALWTFLFTLAVVAALIYLIGYFIPAIAHDLALAALAHAALTLVERLAKVALQIVSTFGGLLIQTLRTVVTTHRILHP